MRPSSPQMMSLARRIGPLLAIGFLACAALAAALLEPVPAPLTGSARAVDGDTIRLGDTRVRLLGIDAPELAQFCSDQNGVQWSCGARARDIMSSLLAGGSTACRPSGHDKYGRVLAHCGAGDEDIGAAMVGAGLAISDGEYGAEEAAARAAKAGIWSGQFEVPRSWRDEQNRAGEPNLFDWLRGWFR